MKKEVWRFLKVLITIIIFIVIIDIVFGIVTERYLMNKNIGIGRFDKYKYIMNYVEDDIIILGSSYANCHYIPSIGESIINNNCNNNNFTIYNAGNDGLHFQNTCCLFDCLIKRYTPKVVILELRTNDLYGEFSDKINKFAPYYYDTIVRFYMKKYNNSKINILNNSSLYRFNGKVGNIRVNDFAMQSKDKMKGWRKKTAGEYFNAQTIKYNKLIYKGEPNKDKIYLLDRIIKICNEKDIKLIVVTSPQYRQDYGSFNYLEKYCNERNVLYYNFSNLFDENPNLFFDRTHLNENGAKIYSKTFFETVKSYICQ